MGEIARQRQMQKEALEHQAKQREKFLAIITILGLVVIGGGGIFYWVAWMKDWL